jgi:hypothetical protein
MRKTTQILSVLTFASLLVWAPVMYAQGVQEKTEKTTTTTTTTTTSGTVSSMGQDAIVIKSMTSSAPTSYEFTETTTYVDESGNPVAIETVKSGAPVTIYSMKEGDKLVATKVVVKKSSTTTR